MPSAGQLIGDYRLLEPLGHGAFGAVWLAEHSRLQNPVAIKFASEVDRERVERFLREARLVAAIKHRHVVEVIDFGTDGDDAYMIMEFVTGQTLADLMDLETLDPRVAVEIVSQLLKAAEACHRAGVVHRDFKPDNVFVEFDDDGQAFVKLVDFGISKVVDPEQRKRGRKSVIPTHEGRIVGTPEYMAPEQARGDVEVDHRADIYSLGAIMYELLTGRMPFDGPTPSVIVAQVLLGAPKPMADLRPDLPGLTAVVERAMAKERDERFMDVRAMRIALAEAAEVDLGMIREHVSGRLRLSTPGFAMLASPPPEKPPAADESAATMDALEGFDGFGGPVLARPGRTGARWWALGAGVVILLGGLAWALLPRGGGAGPASDRTTGVAPTEDGSDGADRSGDSAQPRETVETTPTTVPEPPVMAAELDEPQETTEGQAPEPSPREVRRRPSANDSSRNDEGDDPTSEMNEPSEMGSPREERPPGMTGVVRELDF